MIKFCGFGHPRKIFSDKKFRDYNIVYTFCAAVGRRVVGNEEECVFFFELLLFDNSISSFTLI